MRYTVEIDTSTKTGTDALKQLKKLKSSKAISIHKWKKLTAKDVSLPGGLTPTDWQWEEYFSRKQGKGKPAKEVFADIKKRLINKYGS